MDVTNRQPSSILPVLRTDVDPDMVLDAVERLAAAPGDPALTLTVRTGPQPRDLADPTIEVCEHERRIATRLSALTARLSRRGVTPDPGPVTEAVRQWVDSRPVSDQVAASKGIATLGATHEPGVFAWQVTVPRPSGVNLGWVPTMRTPAGFVAQVRRDAQARAQRLTITPWLSGEVTVWLYLLNPALSTAVLTQPDVLAHGRRVEDLYVVFSPGCPVAVAPQAPAIRLAEESSEPHQVLALNHLDTLGWT